MPSWSPTGTALRGHSVTPPGVAGPTSAGGAVGAQLFPPTWGDTPPHSRDRNGRLTWESLHPTPLLHQEGAQRAGSDQPGTHRRSRLEYEPGRFSRAPASGPLRGGPTHGGRIGGWPLGASAGGHWGWLEGPGSAGRAE